jgi:endonuclease/exonuclease/phosphatase family metal-dependent hydrolase
MVRMDYDRVEWLADQVEIAAEDLGDGSESLVPGHYAPPPLPASAFGNVRGAGDCAEAAIGLLGEARAARGHLHAMLGTDVTRLREAVETFRNTDHAAADRMMAAAGGTLQVFTTHVHSEDRGAERGSGHDQERANQINEAGDVVNRTAGPTIFTGDLNETRGADNQASDAINRIDEEYGYTDAGQAAGATSSNGEGARIDYVFTSPEIGVPGDATNVDGGPSDHNGVAVDLEIPPGWGTSR